MGLLSMFCIPKCRTDFLFFPLYIPAACFIFWFLRNDFFISSQIYMNENWDKAWNIILWKTVLFHDKLKSYFLVYILNSIIRNYKNIHLFKVFLVSMQYRWKPLWFFCCWVLWPQAFDIMLMYFWKHVRLSNKRFWSLVCKKTRETFLVRYDFFFLGCVWQILYFIKTELPLNIKGNAIWNNPLQDTVLLYSIFAKYIIRIFLLIW